MVKGLLQAFVAVAFLVLLLTVILPWAGEALTQNAQDQFIPQPSPSAAQ